MITRCKKCNTRMKCSMFSNVYGIKWFKCVKCNRSYKRAYTAEEYAQIGIDIKEHIYHGYEYEPVLYLLDERGQVVKEETP